MSPLAPSTSSACDTVVAFITSDAGRTSDTFHTFGAIGASYTGGTGLTLIPLDDVIVASCIDQLVIILFGS